MIEDVSYELVKAVLPHEGRALLIRPHDTLVFYPEPQKLIVYKYITEDDPVFEGHFPGKPMYRGVDFIECSAQGAIMLAYMLFFKEKPRFKGIPAFRKIHGPVNFPRSVSPKEDIEIEIEFVTTVKELRLDLYVFNANVFKTFSDKSRGKLAAEIKGITGTIIEAK